MYDRFVFVKLKEPWANEQGIAEVLAEIEKVLPNIPGVLSCRAGKPADAHAGKGWDLCLVLRFKTLDDIESYRVHPLHSEFLETFLGPKVEAKRVWNFCTEEFLRAT